MQALEKERTQALTDLLIANMKRVDLEAQLADARELLREAIPHLVSNNHWDGAARIQSLLDLAEEKTDGSRK